MSVEVLQPAQHITPNGYNQRLLHASRILHTSHTESAERLQTCLGEHKVATKIEKSHSHARYGRSASMSVMLATIQVVM